MNKSILEAFSDGVLAIIITIMVLEIKVPHGNELSDLQPLIPIFLSYVLSFIYVGIYWNNHHHMMQTVKNTNGSILWANLYLLFWLSLVPFATAWNGENHFSNATMMVYGFVLLMAGIAYFLLQNIIIKSQGNDSLLKKAVGKDIKGKSSPVLYLLAIIFANFIPFVTGIIYVLVAFMWLVPDKRIEKIINHQ